MRIQPTVAAFALASRLLMAVPARRPRRRRAQVYVRDVVQGRTILASRESGADGDPADADTTAATGNASRTRRAGFKIVKR